MTTADYLESLQNDLSTIVDTLDLDEGTNFTSIATMTTEGEITKGGSSGGFTGHYDAEGLAQIGWTVDDIAYYQNNAILWNSENDNDYKLRSDELNGTAGNYTRFIPKNTSLTNFRDNTYLIGLPLLSLSKTDWSYTFYNCFNLITIPLFNLSNSTATNHMFYNCYNLMHVPLFNLSNSTNTRNMFYCCYSLRSIPQFDTSKVENMRDMFSQCYSLTEVPELDTSKVTNFTTTFNMCYSLSDASLYNILEMCRKASLFTGTKKLTTLGIDATQYGTRIQALSNYQDFLNAGWTIS